MIDATKLKRGDPVWILAYRWWRRGRFLAALPKHVIVEYKLVDGPVKRTRCKPDEDRIQPARVEPSLVQLISDRPIARQGMWEVSS